MMKRSNQPPTEPAQRMSGHRRRSQCGQGLLELGLSIPVLIMVLVGLWDFGRVLMIKNLLTNAARKGAHMAVMSDSHSGTVTQTVADYLTTSGLDTTAAKITITGTDAKTGEFVVVAVSYPVHLMVMKMMRMQYQFTLKSSSTMPHE